MTTHKSKEPVHGYCALCRGGIDAGMCWTFTGQLSRIHADPDDCIAVLRPSVTKAFLRLNPGYKSKHRYEVGGKAPCLNN